MDMEQPRCIECPGFPEADVVAITGAGQDHSRHRTAPARCVYLALKQAALWDGLRTSAWTAPFPLVLERGSKDPAPSFLRVTDVKGRVANANATIDLRAFSRVAHDAIGELRANAAAARLQAQSLCVGVDSDIRLAPLLAAIDNAAAVKLAALEAQITRADEALEALTAALAEATRYFCEDSFTTFDVVLSAAGRWWPRMQAAFALSAAVPREPTSPTLFILPSFPPGPELARLVTQQVRAQDVQCVGLLLRAFGAAGHGGYRHAPVRGRGELAHPMLSFHVKATPTARAVPGFDAAQFGAELQRLLHVDATWAPFRFWDAEPWTCTACTLLNDASQRVCEACGTSRPEALLTLDELEPASVAVACVSGIGSALALHANAVRDDDASAVLVTVTVPAAAATEQGEDQGSRVRGELRVRCVQVAGMPVALQT
jgi:hypothetical protein